MGVITSYPNDDSVTSGDRYLTTDESGATKLTTASGIKSYVLSAGNVGTTALADSSVTAAKTSFGGNYTSSEVNTGFTWVDGKTIYKKTLSLGTLPNNTFKNVAHSITSLDAVVHMYGIAISGTINLPLPYVSTSTSILLNRDGINVSVVTTTDRTGYTGYVTLFYTKV